MPAVDARRGAGAVRADDLRRAVASTQDSATRARLHVQLAELLRPRDMSAALDELRIAAAEAPGLPAVTMAVLSVARTLPAKERLALLGELAPKAEAAVPAWAVAAAEAEAEVGGPERAAHAWLTLARDERVPLHRRRVAARKAEASAAGVAPDVQRAALRLSASLSAGSSRLGYLRRALVLAEAVAGPDELVALATEWLEAGGAGRAVDAALARAQAGGSVQALDRATAEATRRGSRTRAAGPVNGDRHGDRHAAQPPARLGGPAASSPAVPAPSAAERLDLALAEAKAGRANRARRLAEEALRSAPPSETLAARAAALETALREGGYLKEALRVRRTFLEGLPEAARQAPLAALADEAAQAGLTALARTWRADANLPTSRTAAAPLPAELVTPAEHYVHAQRLLARLGAGDIEPVLATLERAVAGHAGAEAALALAERLLARVADGEELERRRLELLRAAHAAEIEPSRRLRLGEHLAAALARLDDPVGAVAVLEQALRSAPPGEGGAHLRGERARLLRKMGRGRDLATALENDAAALVGDERLRALSERASLLDAAGEFEAALDVRLMALAEFPGDLALVGAARKRLESTGRPGESLRLALAAVERVGEVKEKLRLLRDIAALSERAGANPAEAANAWLAVLDLAPDDASARAAAERLLLAVGDWERCAELLSWAAARQVNAAGADAARASTSEPRASLLWRLAELRRARLGQTDEAMRLYGELLAESGRALGPLHDSPELVTLARREAALGLHSARASVAPTPPDRALALLDRALLLLERGRNTDAEHDVKRALDLDPRNIACVAALERLYEGSARWVELAHELRQRAAALPPEPAARLWFGAGRASERTGDRVAAREAYRRAMSLDPALPEPIASLGALAARDGDWSEVATLLESEVALVGPSARKGRLLAELAAVHGERLGNPQRGIELVEAAAALLPEEPRLLDLASRFNLLAGRWEPAVQALDRLAALGAVPADAAERYARAGAAAEAVGQVDRALILYSRSYARDPSYRPTLERLSQICFEKDQWDNAWKATEALLDRHGAALSAGDRAVLLLRSAIADLHVAARAQATVRLGAVVTRGGGFSPDVGIRDVAESWSAMRAEPRLLANMERGRRDRVVARATEALALALGTAPAAVAEAHLAREVLGALAFVEERWEDALGLLAALSDEPGAKPSEVCGYLLAAGDIRRGKLGDDAGAQALFARAASVAPKDSRVASRLPGALATSLAHDVTDEMIL